MTRDESPLLPLHLRLSNDIRRTAIYPMVCLPPLAALAFWVRGPSAAPGAGILVAVAMAMVFPLRWALRVDELGVARRRLIGWELWEWGVFESGMIHKEHPFTFIDPRRPWWRNKLRLGSLSRDDVKRVIALINSRYQLPPSPSIPDSLTINFGFRRRAAMGSTGIDLTTGGRQQFYSWGDVRRVHITRMDPLRRDFSVLEIFLPDDAITLRVLSQYGMPSPTWQGAASEELNQLLHRHVPANRIDADIWGESPAKREDAERALAKETRLRKVMRIEQGVCLLVLSGGGVWAAAVSGALMPVLGMLALYLMLFGPVFWFLNRNARKRITATEKQIAEFDDTTGDG